MAAYTTVDLTVGERVIAPGDKFTVRLQAEATQPTIRYVVFDDDTGKVIPAQLRNCKTDAREGVSS